MLPVKNFNRKRFQRASNMQIQNYSSFYKRTFELCLKQIALLHFVIATIKTATLGDKISIQHNS